MAHKEFERGQKTVYTQKGTVHTYVGRGCFYVGYLGPVKIWKTVVKHFVMRKCVILFVILIVVLVFAAVSDHKEVNEIRTDWKQVVAKKWPFSIQTIITILYYQTLYGLSNHLLFIETACSIKSSVWPQSGLDVGFRGNYLIPKRVIKGRTWSGRTLW